MRALNPEELEAIAITAVVVYRIFRTSSGSAKIPGGWQFTWK